MSNANRLIIVEDDAALAESIALEMEERGFEIRLAEGPDDVQTLLKWCPTHAVVDLRLMGHNGLQVVSLLKESVPGCRIVMLTGYGSVPTAVEAMKLGAIDYLSKPVSMDRLFSVLMAEDQDHVPASETTPEEQHESLARHEHEYIEYVLTSCDGNISEAARRLGIHRQSLQRKLRKYPPPR